jgi:hypothetical protein
MNILKAVVLVLLPVSLSVSAADWKPLSGTYAVTAENYLDPSDEEPKNSHFRLQLSGNAAKDLYRALPGKPVKDLCTGGQAKTSGELRCLYFKEQSAYECAFSIDLLESKVEYGVAC